ncbi:MAG: 2'-5' RNA ligase [Eubacterium sp.]|nr:2'-5' RNA ligase [Eubacterium sp.]
MENKSLYILAGYDDLTEKRLAGMQNKLYELGFDGIQTKNIPMHFTLGSYDSEMEEELIARLKKLSENKEAFEVAFNHIGLFKLPENEVLFIAPEVSKEMLDLKDSFLDSKDVFRWSAHTTLLIDKSDIIHNAIPAVVSEFDSFVGKVTRLYLYEFWPTTHIMTVELI